MGSCKYYMEVTLGWMLNNKLIVFLSLLSFSLFVSTLALAGQKNTLSWQLDDCQKLISTTVSPASEATTAAGAATTAAAAGNAEKPDSKLFQLLTGAS